VCSQETNNKNPQVIVSIREILRNIELVKTLCINVAQKHFQK